MEAEQNIRYDLNPFKLIIPNFAVPSANETVAFAGSAKNKCFPFFLSGLIGSRHPDSMMTKSWPDNAAQAGAMLYRRTRKSLICRQDGGRTSAWQQPHWQSSL